MLIAKLVRGMRELLDCVPARLGPAARVRKLALRPLACVRFDTGQVPLHLRKAKREPIAGSDVFGTPWQSQAEAAGLGSKASTCVK